ncbi:MAG: hypothetical protein R3A79_25980 [Nannocystaceae bacterium]
MTLPKRGSRVVEVDGRAFRWMIRARPGEAAAAGEAVMTVAVELAEAPRGTLVVDCGITRPDNARWPHQTAVTPKVVRAAITRALGQGWEPERPGVFTSRYQLIPDAP